MRYRHNRRHHSHTKMAEPIVMSFGMLTVWRKESCSIRVHVGATWCIRFDQSINPLSTTTRAVAIITVATGHLFGDY